MKKKIFHIITDGRDFLHREPDIAFFYPGNSLVHILYVTFKKKSRAKLVRSVMLILFRKYIHAIFIYLYYLVDFSPTAPPVNMFEQYKI